MTEMVLLLLSVDAVVVLPGRRQTRTCRHNHSSNGRMMMIFSAIAVIFYTFHCQHRYFAFLLILLLILLRLFVRSGSYWCHQIILFSLESIFTFCVVSHGTSSCTSCTEREIAPYGSFPLFFAFNTSIFVEMFNRKCSIGNVQSSSLCLRC